MPHKVPGRTLKNCETPVLSKPLKLLCLCRIYAPTPHLGVDAETGQIVASALTSKEADDGAQTGALLDQITDPVASFTGDGAYDQDAVYAAVAERHPDAAVIVPPRSTAVPGGTAETAPTQRDHHLQCITEKGRMAWQQASGYNKRAPRPRQRSADGNR